MELNSKKLEKTSRIIYYSISTVLCLFLILLSNNIIRDLDSSIAVPQLEAYENNGKILELNKQLEVQNLEIENLQSKKQTIEKTISTAKANYNNEKQSFDNWVQTRTTLGSPDKDQEVIDRAKNLDDYYKIEQDWQQQLNSVQSKIADENNKSNEINELIEKEKADAYDLYYSAYEKYELQVFLIRLLFVGPVLALGVFFFIRKRKNKFWPLYFGFTLFSVYAFFFGLLPYLPSYGGYVRNSVGILLSLGLGYYSIKKIRTYMELKKAELQTSTQERAKKVQTDTAEKALDNHFCPSCGKDFILKKWESPVNKNMDSETFKLVTNFCRHCGLELFRNCNKCGQKNYAHLPFCSSCGSGIINNTNTESSSTNQTT